LKDTNFIEIDQDLKKKVVNLSEEVSADILEICKKDAAFLQSKNLIDYSALLVVEN
jgi:hypothetical protein